jgi:hypothetical protein
MHRAPRQNPIDSNNHTPQAGSQTLMGEMIFDMRFEVGMITFAMGFEVGLHPPLQYLKLVHYLRLVAVRMMRTSVRTKHMSIRMMRTRAANHSKLQCCAHSLLSRQQLTTKYGLSRHYEINKKLSKHHCGNHCHHLLWASVQ